MENAFPDKVYYLPVYRKALEIFKISRAMAAYFSEEKNVMEMDLSANPSHQFAGSLVTESLQLAPGIASVATATSKASRLRRIKRIRNAAKNLRNYCKKLEFSGVKELEFLAMLRREIQQFDQMVNDWTRKK